MAAFAYALAPRMFMGLGAIGSELWPMAVAPWLVLPLVAVPPGGSAELRCTLESPPSVSVRSTPWRPWRSSSSRRGGSWTRSGRVRWRLLGWWTFSVGLACTWWIGPLLLLSRFKALPFLDWIEDARVTTSSASLPEALRERPSGSPPWEVRATRSGRQAGPRSPTATPFSSAWSLASSPWSAWPMSRHLGPGLRGLSFLGLVCGLPAHRGDLTAVGRALRTSWMGCWRRSATPQVPNRWRLPWPWSGACHPWVTRRWLSRRGHRGPGWPWSCPPGDCRPGLRSCVHRSDPARTLPRGSWQHGLRRRLGCGTSRRRTHTSCCCWGRLPARVWGRAGDEPCSLCPDGWCGTACLWPRAGATRDPSTRSRVSYAGTQGPETAPASGSTPSRDQSAARWRRAGAWKCCKTPPLVACGLPLVEAGARSVASFGGFCQWFERPDRRLGLGTRPNRPLREVEILKIDTGALIQPERSGRVRGGCFRRARERHE